MTCSYISHLAVTPWHHHKITEHYSRTKCVKPKNSQNYMIVSHVQNVLVHYMSPMSSIYNPQNSRVRILNSRVRISQIPCPQSGHRTRGFSSLVLSGRLWWRLGYSVMMTGTVICRQGWEHPLWLPCPQIYIPCPRFLAPCPQIFESKLWIFFIF